MAVAEIRTHTSPFGAHLKYWRTSRGFTQLELAHRAASTPRYVSFMETGRSRPGEAMVKRLADALAIPVRERSDFLLAAGYQFQCEQQGLDRETMVPFQRAVRYTVAAHEPFPSFGINRWYDIVEKNKAAEAMFGGNNPHKKLNILHSIFDDADTRDRMENWSTVALAMASRLRREAAALPDDKRLQDLLQMAHASISQCDAEDTRDGDDIVICPTFRVGEQSVRTIFMVARFGWPHEVIRDELRVETIFPRDTDAEGFFAALASGALPNHPCWPV